MKQLLFLFSILFSISSCFDRNKTNDIHVVDELSKQVASTTNKQIDSSQIERKDAEHFIVMFMNNTYFNSICESEKWAKQYLTDRMCSYLEEMYLTEADSVEGHHYIAEWAFRLEPEMEQKLQNKENMRVYHHKDDWYVVQFGEGKRTKLNSYLLKIIKDKDVFKIDNIINEGMGFDGITEK